MLTSPFVDLLTDPHLFVPFRHPQSRARNLRVGYIFSLVGGSFRSYPLFLPSGHSRLASDPASMLPTAAVGAGLIKAHSTELVWWLAVGIRFVIFFWVVALEGEKPPAVEGVCIG